MISNRDPLQGLIDYVNAIKPFHTKIAEVRVQYNYAETVNVTITDSLSFDITISMFENMISNIGDNYYFNVERLFQQDVVRVTVVDRTSNGGWDLPAWDMEGWSLPFVGPFMTINQTLVENINIPMIDITPAIATNAENTTIGVAITDELSFIGAAQPTLRLYDTVGVSIVENTQAVVEGLNLLCSWDAGFWDIGSIDENMSVLINLYGNTYPPA